jgi:hypothetical protein
VGERTIHAAWRKLLGMSQIRKAHSVEIIDRRLRDLEVGGVADVMELVGLHDELTRVERKWLDKSKQPAHTGPRARPPADPAAMNGRFERLGRLVEAALRKPGPESPERALLGRVAAALRGRTPLPTEAPAGE